MAMSMRRGRDPEGRMPVMSHLRELRRRIIIMVLIVAVGSIAGWVFYDPILRFLEEPYCRIPARNRVDTGYVGGGCRLIFTAPLEGFITRLKVSVIAGAVVTGPLWLYQIWGFITPGLRKNERKYSLIFIAASTILFVAGMVLAFVTLFKGLPILIGAGGKYAAAFLTINYYLSFVILMLLVFGAAFELPLLVILGNLAGVLPSKWLRKSARFAVFLIFAFAAVATPSTDPFTMCAMAIPMCILYGGAVAFATVHDKRKARRQAEYAAANHLDDDVASTIDPIPERLEPQVWSDTT